MSAKDHRPQIVMNYRDVAVALVCANHLHEGFWRVALEFGQVVAANVNLNGRTCPSAFVPVLGIRLVRDEAANDLTVDAAEVNPLSQILRPEMVLRAN